MGPRLAELETLVGTSLLRLGEGATGTAVYEDLDARLDHPPTVAAVHVTLRRMEDKGLVRSRTGDVSARGGRPQRHYRLTPVGEEALRAARTLWRSVWEGLEIPEPGDAS